jgi:hypothetical protein
MYVTCSIAQLDSLCIEQTGLSGAAQVNAAIAQLFQEAHEEIVKSPRCRDSAQDDDDALVDDFGEDRSPERCKPRNEAATCWQIQSQQPWQLGKEHCTLTIVENAKESLIQFELLKHSTHSNIYVTCSNAQFDDLCAEQTGLSGTAQINAAIAQLFSEAHDEIENDFLGRRNLGDSHNDDGDDFGEDDGASVANPATTTEASSGASWQVRSQQPWHLGKEHCTLTILENSKEKLIQFELLKHSAHATVYVTCSNAQFDELCAEQVGLSGTAQISAAIAQLFKEAHDEIQQSPRKS